MWNECFLERPHRRRGEAYILDHLHTIVGHAHLTAAPGIGMGVSPYSSRVTYDTSFKGDPQG